MPAPSDEVLHNFSGHFAAASRQIIAATGFTEGFLEREAHRLQAGVRYEISFSLGEATNQETLDDGRKVYDAFNAALRLRLVTARRPAASTSGQAAREMHDLFAARLLAAMQEYRLPFAGRLEWYTVVTLRPLGATPGFDPLYLEDFTDIDLALQFGIKRFAWPTLS